MKKSNKKDEERRKLMSNYLRWELWGKADAAFRTKILSAEDLLAVFGMLTAMMAGRFQNTEMAFSEVFKSYENKLLEIKDEFFGSNGSATSKPVCTKSSVAKQKGKSSKNRNAKSG